MAAGGALPEAAPPRDRLKLTNVADVTGLAAHRNKRDRFTVEIASRDIRKVPDRNEWRATYRARILGVCVQAR